MFKWLVELFGGNPYYISIAETVARMAETKIGVRESGGFNKGEDLKPFFDSDWYKPNATDDGYAWCASFVCWCVKQAVAGRKINFKRPRTPSAWGFEDWALAQPSSIRTKKPPKGDIQRGDIVVFKFSHIGVAVSKPDRKGYFYTVEGNTNDAGSREGDGVYRKRRHTGQIRSRIRIKG